MAKKRNKVYFNKGVAYRFDDNGKKVNIETLDEANLIQARCCGLDCCNNKLAMPINDANGTDTYPATFEIINVAGTLKLRVITDLGAGTIVKEVSLA